MKILNGIEVISAERENFLTTTLFVLQAMRFIYIYVTLRSEIGES